MVRKRTAALSLLLPLLLFLSGCPKDPYRAASQGSADVAQAVHSATVIAGSYYKSGTIGDAQKAEVGQYLSIVVDCNTKFRTSIRAVHDTGGTGISAFLPVADGFVQCVGDQANVMRDSKLYNILKAVDTAINSVALAVASAKGAGK